MSGKTRDFGPLSDKIISISLREDVQVQIYGLPYDLTPAEAAKVARVITALAAAGPESLGVPQEATNPQSTTEGPSK